MEHANGGEPASLRAPTAWTSSHRATWQNCQGMGAQRRCELTLFLCAFLMCMRLCVLERGLSL
jgi:hypothetical protein